MPQNIIASGEERMNKTIAVLEKELDLIRTSRANPAILNNVNIVYYGVNTPINQIATISVPEAQTLMIKPYDRTALRDIEKAIQLADLNLVPMNDGNVIRINFPPLTEQRRKELVKKVKSMGENYKVIIRNIRRDMMEQMKKIEKEALITEDDLKKESENIQKLTDKYVNKIDDIIRDKEKAIMEI
jgi:ribosome recycling factor